MLANGAVGEDLDGVGGYVRIPSLIGSLNHVLHS